MADVTNNGGTQTNGSGAPVSASDAREARIAATVAAMKEPVVDPTVPDPAASGDEAAKVAKAAADKKVADDKAATDKKKADEEKAKLDAANSGKTPEQIAAEEAAKAEADEDPDGLPAEIAANPKVQALKAKADEAQLFRDVLVEGYAIPTETQDGKERPVAEILNDLRLERADAHALYNIVTGQAEVSALFNFLEDPNRYKVEVPQRIYTDIVNHLAKNQFLQSYLSANGLKVVKADFKLPDGTAPEAADLTKKPENERIAKLEGELAKQQTAEQQRKQNEAAQKTAAERQVVEKAFVGKVTELFNAKGVDASLLNEYIKGVSDQVSGNPAILQRIAKSNWPDVQKFFTLFHNQMLTKAKKYAQQISSDKEKVRETVPKAPAGGSPPANGASTKRSFKTREERVAAVAADLEAQ